MNKRRIRARIRESKLTQEEESFQYLQRYGGDSTVINRPLLVRLIQNCYDSVNKNSLVQAQQSLRSTFTDVPIPADLREHFWEALSERS